MLKKTSQGFYVLENLSQQKGLLHGFSTNQFSNMSFLYGERSSVLKNRERFIQKVVGQKPPIISLRQTHSTQTHLVNENNLTLFNQSEKIQGDGLITNLKDTCLLIKSADCLPIIIYDPQKHCVALIHAGWEGVVGKIYYQAILLMVENYGSQVKNLIIGVGPSICPKCYTKDKGSVFPLLPEWKKFIKKKDSQFSIDLGGFTVENLKKIGIPEKNLEITGVCTRENNDFFSHRLSLEEGKPEARFATVVCLV